jgi:hypothetical protein
VGACLLTLALRLSALSGAERTKLGAVVLEKCSRTHTHTEVNTDLCWSRALTNVPYHMHQYVLSWSEQQLQDP